jgi:hypothetical protein
VRVNSRTTCWSCGWPLARLYCKVVAKFKSTGSFGYLGILIGEVESFLLENRAQIQEKGPFFTESAEVENDSGIKTSALIESKGK